MKKTRKQLEYENYMLQARLLIWACTFSKYASFKANGIRRISVNRVIEDFEKCERVGKK